MKGEREREKKRKKEKKGEREGEEGEKKDWKKGGGWGAQGAAFPTALPADRRYPRTRIRCCGGRGCDGL